MAVLNEEGLAAAGRDADAQAALLVIENEHVLLFVGHSRASIRRCVSFIARLLRLKSSGPVGRVRGPIADPPSGPAVSRPVAYRVIEWLKIPEMQIVMSGPLVCCRFLSGRNRLFVMMGSGVRISLAAPPSLLKTYNPEKHSNSAPAMPLSLRQKARRRERCRSGSRREGEDGDGLSDSERPGLGRRE